LILSIDLVSLSVTRCGCSASNSAIRKLKDLKVKNLKAKDLKAKSPTIVGLFLWQFALADSVALYHSRALLAAVD
jgi:hypothetical protein